MDPTCKLNHNRNIGGRGSGNIRTSARWGWRTVLLLSLSCFLVTPLVQAETLEDQMRAMRLEIERLHQELDALREELRRTMQTARVAEATRQAPQREESVVAGPSKPPGVTRAEEEQAPSPAEAIPLLQAQITEQAQTKVESNSRLPVKFFGAVVSNTFFNTGEANWLDLPNIVGLPAKSGPSGGSFNFSLRQSKLGAIVQGLAVGSLKGTGFFGMDFYGGSPSGQPIGIPRILYAYFRLEGDNTAFEAGQDEMILAPRNPTSLAALAVPELFRSGNLYLRVPQIRLERTFMATDHGELEAVAGILAPAGAFGSYDGYPIGRSRYPAAQARLGWRAKPVGPGEEPSWAVGVSGHYGRERMAAQVMESWASAVDFDVRAGRLGFGGEGFIGRNIGALGGSLGQRAKSLGGYLEGRLRATRRLEFNAGFGTDQLFDRLAYPAPLAKNEGVFANTIFQFTPELQTSFEYRWLATTPDQGALRRNNHFDLTLAYSF